MLIININVIEINPIIIDSSSPLNDVDETVGERCFVTVFATNRERKHANLDPTRAREKHPRGYRVQRIPVEIMHYESARG